MSDGRRQAGLIEDALHLITDSLNEVVPPAAQVHFLNAQKELILGLIVVIEHNSQRSLRDPGRTPARERRRTAAKRAATTRTRRRRGAEPPEPPENPRRPQRVSLD